VREYSPHLAETYCNVGRLSQVLLNLLSNAAQSFSSAGPEGNEIRIRTAQVGDQVRIEIEDNGRGIPAEALPDLFEPFFTTRRAEGGTGLGLAIAKENIEALGGTLSVRSELGAGTCFTVTLPVRRPSGPLPEPPPPELRESDTVGRVLVIDDEPALLRSLRRVLGRSSQVTMSTSTGAALELIAQQSFDAIVCDVMVPDMSGIAFLEELRRGWPELARRLIFITGGTFSADEEAQLERSGRPVLRKPIDPEQLLRVVADTIASGSS
jgi:CheY-like chemotaxis protein/anti-sigma regulatory factor (Ser/Thr protein kinase)